MNETAQEKRTAEETKIPDYQADEYLRELVRLVSGTESSFPVTLYMNGLVISGQIVSGHRYFEELRDQYAIYFGDSENSKKTIDYLTSPGKIYLDSDENKSMPPIRYIHLQNARVMSNGNKPMPAEGVWWRGRISSIDAFNFGAFVYTENDA